MSGKPWEGKNLATILRDENWRTCTVEEGTYNVELCYSQRQWQLRETTTGKVKWLEKGKTFVGPKLDKETNKLVVLEVGIKKPLDVYKELDISPPGSVLAA